MSWSSELTMRDASPISRVLTLERAMESHSSNNKTHGRSLAAMKMLRRLVADSPKYDEMRASKRTFINGRPVFHARRLAPRDFPQPGGPYKRMVFLGRSPKVPSRSRAAYSASTRAKRSSVAADKTM